MGAQSGCYPSVDSHGLGVSCFTEAHMQFEAFSFGSIRIDGVTYDHDVLI